MVSKDSVTLLRKAVESNKDYVTACREVDIPVICVSRETGKNKNMAFKVLYTNNNQFWLQNEVWEYFLLNEDHAKVTEHLSKVKEEWSPEIKVTSDEGTGKTGEASDDGYGKKYETIVSMPEPQRVLLLTESKNRLDSLIAQKPRQEQLITEALVETTCDAVMHNHASLMDALNLTDDEAKQQTQKMVDSTRDLVKSSTQLISTDIFNDELMNALVSKSNGTIIQHMTRVYLNGLAFLSYYNNLVSGSSIINKVRIEFDRRYKSFYQTLLPQTHPDFINLESVFLGGMRVVSGNDFYNWAVGFLVHDIGKAAAVEYHEGESAYNRDIVMEHVKVGYDSITHKTNYPRDAALITGYHHEYYGDEAGYGYYRSDFEHYKKTNPQTKQNHCIAFDPATIANFDALAFFPAKVLEIIDVFDSLTDPNRKYRKAMTTEEALGMMREEFIVKHQKIDIIIFELFSHFVREKQAA